MNPDNSDQAMKGHNAAITAAMSEAQRGNSPPEVRITDPVTGGQKGQKSSQLGAIDPLALLTLGEVAGMGSAKYARYNYAKGFDWSLAIDALLRHLLLFAGGQDFDDESGLPHTAHVAWQALCLTTFLQRGLGTDDRFPRE